jgi:hypothetical protein
MREQLQKLGDLFAVQLGENGTAVPELERK